MAECLTETLDDREEEDGSSDEAVPLVPLTETANASMEDHTFLKFIAQMGLAPPANEQVRSNPLAMFSPQHEKNINFNPFVV